jgi:glutaredoxin
VYRNVQRDPAAMKDMLAATGGRRDVPVIIDGGKATVGYGGS